jgi:hypothetical protein
MTTPCFVYSLRNKIDTSAEDALREWANSYLDASLTGWMSTVADFKVLHELPADWYDQGVLFTKTRELRWHRQGTRVEALLLSDLSIEGLRHMSGSWTSEAQQVYLQDLSARHIRPTMRQYPHGSSNGQLSVKIYRRDGITMVLSPRQWQ